jgi:hypothetical protein
MQEEIHELLLSFAEAGANVVRLKGGDPLVICSCLQIYLTPDDYFGTYVCYPISNNKIGLTNFPCDSVTKH